MMALSSQLPGQFGGFLLSQIAPAVIRMKPSSGRSYFTCTAFVLILNFKITWTAGVGE